MGKLECIVDAKAIRKLRRTGLPTVAVTPPRMTSDLRLVPPASAANRGRALNQERRLRMLEGAYVTAAIGVAALLWWTVL